MDNYIEITNSNYNFSYYNKTYLINQNSPIIELKRYFLINEIKEQMSQIIKKHNIDLDINNTFPRWLMFNVGSDKYLIDPVINIYNHDYTIFINDIKYFNKNIKQIQIDNLIKDLKILDKCKYVVDRSEERRVGKEC